MVCWQVVVYGGVMAGGVAWPCADRWWCIVVWWQVVVYGRVLAGGGVLPCAGRWWCIVV